MVQNAETGENRKILHNASTEIILKNSPNKSFVEGTLKNAESNEEDQEPSVTLAVVSDASFKTKYQYQLDSQKCYDNFAEI